MRYKSIIATREDGSAVVSIDDKMYMYVDSRGRLVRHSMVYWTLIRGVGWTETPLTDGDEIEKTLQIIGSMPEPDEFYGIGEERYTQLSNQKKYFESQGFYAEST